jgi:hypothetical protein
MDNVMHIRNTDEIYFAPQPKYVPDNIAGSEKPDKEESINNMRTRFLM